MHAKQSIFETVQYIETRPSALGMSDPGVEPLEILELEAPPYPCPPCPCPPCRLVK